MAEGGVLLLGFPGEPSMDDVEMFGLGDDRRTVHGLTLVRAQPASPDWLVQVGRGLQSEQLQTAALILSIPDDQEIWIATEWRGKLVVHSSLVSVLQSIADVWEREQYREDLQLLILSPRADLPERSSVVEVATSAAFRTALWDQEATVVRAKLDDVLAAPERWFGDLAPGSAGGATALVLTSARDRQGSWVLLRNPAALGWSLAPDSLPLAPSVRSKQVRVHARGFSRTSFEETELAAASGPPSGHGNFVVALQMTAQGEDPEVVVPAGAIFEPSVSGNYQALGTSERRTVTVSPGTTVTIAMAGWCLNRWLPAPQGEELGSTLLRLSWTPSSQEEVWNDVDRRLEVSSKWRGPSR